MARFSNVHISDLMGWVLKKFVNNIFFLILISSMIVPISQYSSFAQQPPSEQPPSVQRPPSEQPPSIEQPPSADQPPSLDQLPSIEQPPSADQPASSEQPKLTQQPSGQQNGGCLIATATYGSELAPQVQFLREVRDNTVLSTASGTSFMTAFNSFYYSFSPTIADWERQNPVFKEAVKISITPLLSTLSIMILAEDSSEVQVLGLGISVIALNIAMYFVAPTIVIYKIKSKLNGSNFKK